MFINNVKDDGTVNLILCQRRDWTTHFNVVELF